MLRDFAILLSWADAFALSKKVLTQLEVASTFSADSHFKLLRLTQSTFPGKELLRVKENRTHSNPIVNASAAKVEKRTSSEGIAWYKSVKALLQDYLLENVARMWVA